MISKKNLLNSVEIKGFFNQKTRSGQSDFFFVKKKQNSLPYPRFALLLSKSKYKNIVCRNKNKRIIFNLIFKIIKSENFLKNNNDFVLTVKRDIADIDLSDLYNDLVKILN